MSSDAERHQKGLNGLDKLQHELENSLTKAPRLAVIQALEAAMEFINSYEAFRQAGLSSSLQALYFALHDLENGVVAPFLQPFNCGDNRHPDPKAKKIMKAYASYYVDRLVSKKLGLYQSCRFVADVLTDAGFTIVGKQASEPWKTVKNWRGDSSKLSKTDQDYAVLHALRAEPLPKQSLEDAKREIRENLTRLVQLVGRYALD